MTDNYEDIIDLPHHVSKTHPKMPMWNRAAQFAPFAALTGYDAAVKETARLTEGLIELGDDDNDNLNRQMAHLKSIIKEQPIVSVTYFVADNRKQGGSYQNKEGQLKDIDETARCLVFTDGTKIEMNKVIGLEQME